MASTQIPQTLGGVQGTLAAPLAGVGTTLSGAAAISTGTVVGIAAAGQVAFVLPALPAGQSVRFLNVAATAVSATVFPATAAGKLNNGSAGAAVSVAQNKTAEFINLDGADNWMAIVSA
jgi:hypothetical protein